MLVFIFWWIFTIVCAIFIVVFALVDDNEWLVMLFIPLIFVGISLYCTFDFLKYAAERDYINKTYDTKYTTEEWFWLHDVIKPTLKKVE